MREGMIMNQEQINELWQILEDHCQNKKYRPSQVMAFLSTCFVGTVAKHGYSQHFFDETCERMKVGFREKRKDYDD